MALLLGAAMGAALLARFVLPHLGLAERFTRPEAPIARPNHIIARLGDGRTLVMPYESPAPIPPVPRHCAFEPLLPPASAGDGHYRLVGSADAELPSAGAYLEVASDAAAAGRTRDREVALIMACRVSALSGEDAGELRAVRNQLASLYLEQARSAGDGELAGAYRQRAVSLAEGGASGRGNPHDS